MKTGRIMTSPEWRWYEPQHAVLGGGEYFTHAWGSIYVLSGNAALRVAQMPTGSMRFFANEGNFACASNGCIALATAVINTKTDCCNSESHILLRALSPGFKAAFSLSSGLLPCADSCLGVLATDVTLGSWMLAFNVHHFDDRRLCDPWCTPSSLAVYNIPECSGLCNPVKDLVHLHAQSDCVSPALTDGSVPLLPPIFRFNQ
jgi:hypothetical protein